MTEVSSASLAHDLHTKFVEYRASHPTMDRLLHLGYYRASINNGLTGSLSRRDLEAEMKASETYSLVSTELDNTILTRADTVFLTDDLRELVKTAEATMPDEILFETDVYTPCGFVVMETPLPMDIMSRARASEYDELVELVRKHGGRIDGERLFEAPDEHGDYIGLEHWDIQAFAWGNVDSVTPEALADVERKYGRTSKEYEFASREFHPHKVDDRALYVRVYGTMTSTTIDGVNLDVPDMRTAPLRLMDMYVFFYGEDGPRTEDSIYGVDKLDDTHEMGLDSWQRSREIRRFLVALFRLMEEYVDIDKTSIHRAFGKRATRSGRVGDVRNVTVLSLRRALGDNEDGSGAGHKVTLAHLVRGHWRNQWYPSQKQHRAKWIRAHRRGGNAGDEVTARPRIIKVDR